MNFQIICQSNTNLHLHCVLLIGFKFPLSPDSDTNRWGSLELKLHKMEIHVFKKKKMCVVPEMIW